MESFDFGTLRVFVGMPPPAPNTADWRLVRIRFLARCAWGPHELSDVTHGATEVSIRSPHQ